MKTLMPVVLLLVAAAQAEEKKPRAPSFVGVEIAKTKDDACVVRKVLPDSPAQKAGLKGGDVIVRIDGVKPADLKSTVDLIRSLKAGKKVKFEVKRDGKAKTIEVTPASVTG